MAISTVTYSIVRSLFEQKALPQGGAILEFGEANWYGDIPPERIEQDIQAFATDSDRRAALLAEWRRVESLAHQARTFARAKIFYRLFFDYQNIAAIDVHGTEAALKLDLNHPVGLGRAFDVCVNNGTGEHIFNIGQFFATMHQHTKPGGLMFHEGPFTGWIDHGFYTLQPTVFFDLAAVNGYNFLLLCIGTLEPTKILQIKSREQIGQLVRERRIPDNATLYAVLQKGAEDKPFEFPFQGYYADAVSEEAKENWKSLR